MCSNSYESVMKIGELAERSGLTAYTLRYYERIGLLPRAQRDGQCNTAIEGAYRGFTERWTLTSGFTRHDGRGPETAKAYCANNRIRDRLKEHPAFLQSKRLHLCNICIAVFNVTQDQLAPGT